MLIFDYLLVFEFFATSSLVPQQVVFIEQQLVILILRIILKLFKDRMWLMVSVGLQNLSLN